MAGVLSAAALILAAAGPAPLPTEEQMLEVCRSWAGPEVMADPASAQVNKLRPEDIEAYRRGLVLRGMQQNHVALEHLELVELMCGFYLKGSNDSLQWVIKLLDSPKGAEQVALVARQR